MYEKPSVFENVQPPNFSRALARLFSVLMEFIMWLMLFAVFSSGIGLMNETYLSELPLIGNLFSNYIDPDANASHLIAALLATFSVGTPLFIWSEIFRQNILDNPREWISHPQNQIIASMAVLVLLLVISLEVVNLYTLVAKESLPIVFPTQSQENDLMSFLAQNKGMAIGISVVIAVINIILALFSVRAFKHLKSPEGGVTS